MLIQYWCAFTLLLVHAIHCRSKFSPPKRDFYANWVATSVGRPYLKAYEILNTKIIDRISNIDSNIDSAKTKRLVYALECSFNDMSRQLNQSSKALQLIGKSLHQQEQILLNKFNKKQNEVEVLKKDFLAANETLESNKRLIEQSEKAIKDAEEAAQKAENASAVAREVQRKNDNCERERRKRRFINLCDMFPTLGRSRDKEIQQSISTSFRRKHEAEYRLQKLKGTRENYQSRYRFTEKALERAERELNETTDKLKPITDRRGQVAALVTDLRNVEIFVSEVAGGSTAINYQLINLLQFDHLIEPLINIYEQMVKEDLLGTINIQVIHSTKHHVEATSNKLRDLLHKSWDPMDHSSTRIKPSCGSLRDV